MFRYIRLAVAIGAVAIVAGTGSRIVAAQDSSQDAQANDQAQAGDAADAAVTNDVYLVQMADEPVISYRGGIWGRPATKRDGHRQKIDVEDADVQGYARYLDARHDEAISRSGGHKLYGFRYSFNGFAARLTPEEAQALAGTDGVVRVVKDELRSMDTSSTPALLGLNAPGGLWHNLAGPGRAGEDIIIGVIDSGVWPESLSFTDREDKKGVPSASGREVYDDMRRWRYRCQSGEEFTTKNCNNKLIGAQRFNAAWGGDAGIAKDRPWEYTSPRDYNGHGTHTASTAGGNYGVPTTGDAAVFGSISGIAPRARIAVYKALWSTQDGVRAEGFTSDLVAAIEKAVADGVDVINFSVAGSKTNLADPVEIAFFNAASAGVFVASSAGNEGRAEGTVAHPSPWITTVAAATRTRSGNGSVKLGNGEIFTGPSLATAIAAPLVDATFAGRTGVSQTLASQCDGFALDQTKVMGKIVICDRGVGTNTPLNQSLTLKQFGAAGMILLNSTIPANSNNPDFAFVPTVLLAPSARAAVESYAQTAGAGATASIARATVAEEAVAPSIASFSSRGPIAAGGGDLLKPDLAAPGQNILAAVAPTFANMGRSFSLYNGTSMSTPHVAGLAALMMHLKREDGDNDHDHDRHGGRDRHGRWRGHDSDFDDEGWSPMMIKSALMTTATDVVLADSPSLPTTCASKPAGATADPCWQAFSQGAGFIDPTQAMDPGLVFDSDDDDWVAFMCGAAPEAVHPWECWWLKRRGFSFDASDLNVPSIAIGDLTGVQTVTRTVTNVGRSRATYTASVDGMAGIDVTVSPAKFTIKPGKSVTFKVTFKRTTASLSRYTGGHLTLTDGNHNVRVPMAIRPIAFVAPAEVFSTGGPISYPVKFGYDGGFTATVRGLVPAMVNAGSVIDDPTDLFLPQRTSGDIFKMTVTIPAGTSLARFSLFGADAAPDADLDLYVYRGATPVAASGVEGSDEEISLTTPFPAVYTVYVHGYDVNGSSNFKLHTWLVGAAENGNVTMTAPAAAITGAAANIGLSFADSLTPDTKYLGSVSYGGVPVTVTPTVIRVDVPAGQ